MNKEQHHESVDLKLNFYRESITDTMKQKPCPGDLKSIVQLYLLYTYTGISKISSQYTVSITAAASFSSFTFTAFVNSEVW